MTEKEQMEGFLFEELKNGNSRAFDKIFTDQYQNLCRFAYSIVHDEDYANSLVQNVFIRLWENRTSLGHIDHLTVYLITMVRNHCLNFIKREKRNTKLENIPAGAQSENTTEDQVDVHDFGELAGEESDILNNWKSADKLNLLEYIDLKDIWKNSTRHVMPSAMDLCKSLNTTRKKAGIHRNSNRKVILKSRQKTIKQ